MSVQLSDAQRIALSDCVAYLLERLAQHKQAAESAEFPGPQDSTAERPAAQAAWPGNYAPHRRAAQTEGSR